MSEPQFSLSDYLSTVQEVIQITFNEPVWVKAEIRNLNIKGGHYYLELAEKDENTDKVIATCKGTICKFTVQTFMLLLFCVDYGFIRISNLLNDEICCY